MTISRRCGPTVVALALLALASSLNGCGKSGFDTVHNCSNCTVPRFLFAAASNAILSYTVAASGVPTAIGTMSGPNQSQGIVADSSGSFLYVSDFQNSAVDAFTINATNGALTPIAGSPFAVGNAPDAGGIAIDHSTRFLYVTLLNSGAVAGFSIAAGTGALTLIAGSPFPAGNTPMQAVIDPGGKFLYVSNYNDSMGTISAYTINTTTGALTPVVGSPFPTQPNFPGPSGLAFGAGGAFLYVGMAGTVNANNAITAFSVDSTTGALTQIAGSPFSAGRDPIRIASDPTGKFLFTANLQDGTVSAFTVDSSSGALSPAIGSPFTLQGAPSAIATDTTGSILYVGMQPPLTTGNSGLSVLSINSTTGSLTPLAGSPFFAGQSFTDIALATP